MNPRYPVYILSFDRWQPKRRLTAAALERMHVPYTIVVEPEEYQKYMEVTDHRYGNVKIMDQQYHYNFEACCAHPPNQRQGSGPVRNMIWDDAISRGFERHWVMDDNIDGFTRYNKNRHIVVNDGTVLRAMEDFVDRYENVALAGPCYWGFIMHLAKHPPFMTNRRIYSCLLIKNDIPFRWRCRYNDDTDLSLRVLKAGYATIQFCAFTQMKKPTQTIPGGLTGQIYMQEGTLRKSKMLASLHPDVARVVWKFNRWHHEVDYRPFQKTKLIPKPDLQVEDGINEYGMKVIEREDAKNK